MSMHRWTVDTPEDYEMMSSLFELMEDPETITWKEVLKLINSHPELEMINASSHAKDVQVTDTRS